MEQNMREIAQDWAMRMKCPVRDEEDYVRLHESNEPGIITGLFLDTASKGEIAEFIMRCMNERCTFWGVVPPYTGSDTFAGRMVTPPEDPTQRTVGIASRSHIHFDSDQQRQFRQHLRLVVIIPNTPTPR